MWLDEIEAMYEIDKFPSRGTTGHIGRMARVLRELGDLVRHIDMCQECADTTYKDCSRAAWGLSDDAKELLG